MIPVPWACILSIGQKRSTGEGSVAASFEQEGPGGEGAMESMK